MSLNICSNGHGEVCYEEPNCPACDLKEDLKSELDERDSKIDDLEAEISEYHKE